MQILQKMKSKKWLMKLDTQKDVVNANFLLTGDKDLRALERHNITKIISYSEFMSIFDDLVNQA